MAVIPWYTLKQLKDSVSKSYSYSEILRNLGLNVSGESYRRIRLKVINLKIDTSHFCRKQETKNRHKNNWKDVLIFNPETKCRKDSKLLRKYLIEIGRKYVCEECGIANIWNNKNITLEVDHIDGNWRNNTPENLRFLCPNCHSQTSNFFNKKDPNSKKSKWETKKKCPDCQINYCSLMSNTCLKCSAKKPENRKRKVPLPSKEFLEKVIWEKTTKSIAQDFGVTDKAVEKWCKKYGISKPPRGYWQKLKAKNKNEKLN